MKYLIGKEFGVMKATKKAARRSDFFVFLYLLLLCFAILLLIKEVSANYGACILCKKTGVTFTVVVFQHGECYDSLIVHINKKKRCEKLNLPLIAKRKYPTRTTQLVILQDNGKSISSPQRHNMYVYIIVKALFTSPISPIMYYLITQFTQ